jgi:hypothetical protein
MNSTDEITSRQVAVGARYSKSSGDPSSRQVAAPSLRYGPPGDGRYPDDFGSLSGQPNRHRQQEVFHMNAEQHAHACSEFVQSMLALVSLQTAKDRGELDEKQEAMVRQTVAYLSELLVRLTLPF